MARLQPTSSVPGRSAAAPGTTSEVARRDELTELEVSDADDNPVKAAVHVKRGSLPDLHLDPDQKDIEIPRRAGGGFVHSLLLSVLGQDDVYESQPRRKLARAAR